MRKYNLKPSAQYIVCGTLLLLAAAATVLARVYLVSFEILMYTLIGIFWGLAVLFGLILLPMYFRRTVIYVSQVNMTIHTGLVMLRREHIRMEAVQYVTRMSLPLANLSGFNFIIVRALGGSMILPFLNAVDCDEIMGILELEISKRL